MVKKELEVVILSDVHLGTYGCHAKELIQYLNSIKPELLIINGDFFDAWQFKKRYFPKEHLQVIQEIIKMSVSGTKVFYITGNHDDIFRKFGELSAGNIHLRDKLVLHLQDKKYWIFHGDIFDFTVLSSPILAKLGGKGYDLLILFNRMINKSRVRFGLQPWSLAKKVKSGVKRAIKFIADFEHKAIHVAHEKGFDYVVCGHIHQPQIRKVDIKGHVVTYLNSGDWVESLTALEYRFGNWQLYKYDEADFNFVNRKLVPTTDAEVMLGLTKSLKKKAWFKRIVENAESNFQDHILR